MATVWQEPKQQAATRSAGRSWAWRAAVVFWLALPLAAVWWHMGPGEKSYAREKAAGLIAQGEASAEVGDWLRAAQQYDAALGHLPAEDVAERQQVSVAQAAALVQAGNLVDGQDKLQALVVDLENGAAVESETLETARHELATASYYTAWMMRLEGASREEWLPECERARQQFRMLAETSAEAGEEESATRVFEENLEATIRLEQMDLSELRALPPPCNCNGNCSQKKRQQQRSRNRSRRSGNNESEQEQRPQDARQQVQEQRAAGVSSGGSGGS